MYQILGFFLHIFHFLLQLSFFYQLICQERPVWLNENSIIFKMLRQTFKVVQSPFTYFLISATYYMYFCRFVYQFFRKTLPPFPYSWGLALSHGFFFEYYILAKVFPISGQQIFITSISIQLIGLYEALYGPASLNNCRVTNTI